MSDNKFDQANCSHCGLRNEQAGYNTSCRSALMIISDHPTMTEVIYKTQLAGMSGDLLKKIMVQLGLDISRINFTYATMCRVSDPKGVSSSELACCRARLVQEIKNCAPKVIVPMGNTALQQLMQRKDPITSMHGQVLWSHEFNCHIIPAYHPGAVVKAPKVFTDFAKDWQTVVDTLKNPPVLGAVLDLKTKFWVVPPDKLSATVDFLLQQSFISCDLETTGFSPITNRAFCGSFTWEEGKSLVFDEDILYNIHTTYFEEFKRLFETLGPKWIWKNGKFDIKFIRAAGIKARIDEDVELQHYLLDERKGTHGLELLASQELGAPDYKSVIRKLVEAGGGDYSHADRMKMLEYNANDTDYTFRLWKIYDRRLKAEDNLIYAYYEVLIPAANALADFELTGVNADTTYLEQLGDEYDEKIASVKNLLLSISDEVGWNCLEYQQHTQAKKPPKVFNPGSWQQLGYVIFKLLKLPKYKGSTTTDADAVDYWLNKVLKKPNDKAIEKSPALLTEWLAKSNVNVFIYRLAEYRKITKLNSTYITGLMEQIELDGRIHTEFKIIGTETGRLSSKGPNVQNVPRGKLIKSAFIPSPGNVFIQADYSQAELRVLAILSKDPVMMQIYYDGKDLHDELSLTLFGPGFTKEQRVRAKAFNFGVAYGRTPESIAEEHAFPVSEARALKDAWYSRFSVAADYIEHSRKTPSLGITQQTPFGRKRRFPFITKENAWNIENEAVNFPIQSTASDLTLLSAVQLHKQTSSLADILILVHDSILFDVPKENVDALVPQILNVMQTLPGKYLNTDMPFIADVEIGHNWGNLDKLK